MLLCLQTLTLLFFPWLDSHYLYLQDVASFYSISSCAIFTEKCDLLWVWSKNHYISPMIQTYWAHPCLHMTWLCDMTHHQGVTAPFRCGIPQNEPEPKSTHCGSNKDYYVITNSENTMKAKPLIWPPHTEKLSWIFVPCEQQSEGATGKTCCLLTKIL